MVEDRKIIFGGVSLSRFYRGVNRGADQAISSISFCLNGKIGYLDHRQPHFDRQNHHYMPFGFSAILAPKYTDALGAISAWG